MKKETIEKYLSKCGVTPSPWGMDDYGLSIYGKSVGGCQMKVDTFKIADMRGRGHLQYLGEEEAEKIQKANQRVLWASHDMLVALIDICYDRAKTMNIERPYHVPVIEQALSRPWEEIRKGLEEMEDEG